MLLTPSDIALVLTAVGGTSILPAIIRGVRGLLSGSYLRERDRLHDLERALVREEAKVKKALLDRDRADMERRIIAEHASHCRRVALDFGVPLEELPPWPSKDGGPF